MSALFMQATLLTEIGGGAQVEGLAIDHATASAYVSLSTGDSPSFIYRMNLTGFVLFGVHQLQTRAGFPEKVYELQHDPAHRQLLALTVVAGAPPLRPRCLRDSLYTTGLFSLCHRPCSACTGPLGFTIKQVYIALGVPPLGPWALDDPSTVASCRQPPPGRLLCDAGVRWCSGGRSLPPPRRTAGKGHSERTPKGIPEGWR